MASSSRNRVPTTRDLAEEDLLMDTFRGRRRLSCASDATDDPAGCVGRLPAGTRRRRQPSGRPLEVNFSSPCSSLLGDEAPPVGGVRNVTDCPGR